MCSRTTPIEAQDQSRDEHPKIAGQGTLWDERVTGGGCDWKNP